METTTYVMMTSGKINNSRSWTWSGSDEYEPPFDDSGIIVAAFIIFTLLVIGAVANSLTIVVLTWYKELSKCVFMKFILSLCVSDLISASISWLFLYRRTWGFDKWSPIPHIFCKIYWAADIMTSYVTALHILCFSVLRYISIRYPFIYKKIKLRHGKIIIATIWLVCIGAGFFPCFFIFGVNVPDRGSDMPDARWPACTALEDRYDAYVLYQKIGYTLFFYGPTVGVVLMCTVVVGLVVARSRGAASTKKAAKRIRKERNAVVQLILIIFSFLLGFVPFTAYEFWSVKRFPNTSYYRSMDYWFGMVGYFLLRFSECLNPLFYNLGSSKVRHHTSLFITTKILRRSYSDDVSLSVRQARRSDNTPDIYDVKTVSSKLGVRI